MGGEFYKMSWCQIIQDVNVIYLRCNTTPLKVLILLIGHIHMESVCKDTKIGVKPEPSWQAIEKR